MIPNATLIERVGDLGGQKIAMTFDENNVAHLMALLIDLYSDPELAVIREYSTNAIDSHIESGQTRPIEISLPGPMSPYFKVRDYGVGLSVDDIENIYSKYGASTKRESNDYNGMMGIGGKSALTYTGQFMITAIKDGRKVSVSVSRVEDGTGQMEIISNSPTNEQNGVEVSVPVQRNNSFERKAREFYQYWAPGTVLINGKPAETFNGQKVSDNLFMVSGHGSDVIVMNNVAYPVEGGLYQNYYKNFRVVAYVKPGEINITPSREGIHMTALSMATIKRITSEFDSNFKKAIEDNINEAASHSEALKRWASWKRMVPFGYTPEYRGKPVPSKFSVSARIWRRKGYHSKEASATNIIDATEVNENTLVVLGYPKDSVPGLVKDKVTSYIDNNGMDKESVIFYGGDTIFGDGWLDFVDTVTWDDLKKIRLNSNRVSNPTTMPGGYEVWNGYTYVKTDTLLTKKEIFYFSPTEKRRVDKKVDIYALTEYFKDATLVKIGKNRWEKFLRLHPNAKHVSERGEEMVKKFVDSITEEDRLSLTYDYNLYRDMNHVDPTRIDDPDLRKYVVAVKNIVNSDFKNRLRAIMTAASIIGVEMPTVTPSKMQNPFVNYPLFSHHHLEDSYFYINAKYHKEKETTALRVGEKEGN